MLYRAYESILEVEWKRKWKLLFRGEFLFVSNPGRKRRVQCPKMRLLASAGGPTCRSPTAQDWSGIVPLK